MKQSLALRTKLSLTMTPALQQAIRLLQLSSLDLQQEIQQVLESNVMLESAADDEFPVEAGQEPITDSQIPEDSASADDGLQVTSEADIPDEMPVDASWDDIYDGTDGGGSRQSDEELYDFLQSNQHGTESLRDHLTWQASIAAFGENEMTIALHLIDAINEDGYLEDWEGLCNRLCQLPGINQSRVDRVLATVQEFDPSGVAARDLTECLRLQLTQQYDKTLPVRDHALQLLELPIPMIAKRDVAHLSEVSGLPLETVPPALDLITSLQPHPGRPYQAHEADYITPDVLVIKRDGRWRVSLNPDHMPRLRINSYYQGMVRRADNSRDQQTLKQHLQEARYFISSLEARNETLLRVASCIVEEQRPFLEYGPEAMRPLVLRNVSEHLGLHESTVSRATANKYMMTPRGLYELKFFFSSHVQTTQGGMCSATAIQAMIKRLVEQEEPTKPLSDATLTDLLRSEGILVARRTIAKYREGLSIPPSHERRR